MSGPPPNPNRQRRNKTTTRASLEAPPITHVPLPTILSDMECVTQVRLQGGCTLPKNRHDIPGWVSINVEPHEFMGKPIPWHPMTTAWWTTIWASPMIAEWVDADVPELYILAKLYDAFWTSPDPRLAAEVRFQLREFGLSPLSRRQLQWEVKRLAETPEKPSALPAPPTRSRDPRLRLVPKVI